jgi:hypothetical protein
VIEGLATKLHDENVTMKARKETMSDPIILKTVAERTSNVENEPQPADNQPKRSLLDLYKVL